MYKAFLLRYSEIGIKGKNRYMFEDALKNQVKFALSKVEGTFNVSKEQGRIFVEAESEFDFDEVITALKRVFGVAAICPVVVIDDNSWDNLTVKVGDYVE